MAPLDIGRLRDDVEPFQSELNEEFYQNYAGLKDEMSTAAIYDRYSHLFSKDALSVVQGALEKAEGTDDSRWLRYLRTFSAMGFMDSAVRTLSDRANTFEARSVVTVGQEQVPYRFVPVRLKNEPDPEKRRALFEAKLIQTDELNIILHERMTVAHDMSVDLGFKNYRDMVQTVKGVDYRALEEQMEEMIRRTENLYVETMEELIGSRMNMPISEAWSYDIPHAFRGTEYDTFFDKDKLVTAFNATMKSLGLDPDGTQNIHLDIEDRPKKTPRAFCAPVKVPDDIRLVIRPTGGYKDYEAFFHEGGHAWHFACTSRAHPAEYRYLGDNSVTEAFAFVFNHLPADKLWLKKTLGMDDSDDYVRFTLVNKLMFLRRYAAKLIYELKLHGAKVSPEFQEIYRNCLQKSLKFRHTGRHYLEDVDDGFYCAEYLRAWLLDGQIRAALTEQFGEDWFQNEKAGAFLKELWSYGQKFTADELVKTIGYVDLDPEPLLQEIERGLRGSGR